MITCNLRLYCVQSSSLLWQLTFKTSEFRAVLTAGSRICRKEVKKCLGDIFLSLDDYSDAMITTSQNPVVP